MFIFDCLKAHNIFVFSVLISPAIVVAIKTYRKHIALVWWEVTSHDFADISVVLFHKKVLF